MKYIAFWSRVAVISFYMTYANLIGFGFGATNLFVTLPLFIVVSFGCAFLQKHKVLSILALFLLLFMIPIVPHSVVNFIVLLPPCLYMIYDVIARLGNKHFRLDISAMLLVYSILYFLVVIHAGIEETGILIRTFVIPYGLSFYLSSITILRSSRHSEHVLESKTFHLINFIAPIFVLIGGLAFSTEGARRIMYSGVQGFFTYIVRPVLRVILFVAVWLVSLITPLFTRIGDEDIFYTKGVPMPDIRELVYEDEGGETFLQFLGYILIIIVLVVCVVFLIKIVQSMGHRLAADVSGERSVSEVRRPLGNDLKSLKKRRKSTGNKIREIYYDYLRLCKKRGIVIEPYMTSQDISVATTKQTNCEKGELLRQLYIKSRYGEYDYSKADVKVAKGLYRELRQAIGKNHINN